MFLLALEKQCATHTGQPVRFVSAGSGNCELEVGLAVGLRARGYTDFVIECLDLNQAMLDRGLDHAQRRGVAVNLAFAEADLNHWVASREYHAVIADQSLHHVLELESLFGQIRQALRPDGVFVISDMIGRNGHLRWPEALVIVQEFWRKLPPSYRFNRRSTRYEALFEDADCSTESFEGIRAQDIVGLLTEYFHFQFFLGFGNVIDPFVDRSFGPNFDPEAAWDREFIDQVHRRDEDEIAAGRLQPTHMLAILGTQPDAARSCRPPRVRVAQAKNGSEITDAPASGYAWGSWPHNSDVEAQRVCRMLEDSENRLKALEKQFASVCSAAQQHEIELQERTAWALDLDRQLSTAAQQHETELGERTAWALDLDRQRTTYIRTIIESDEELVRRTIWAHELEAELAERTEWALQLRTEVTEQTELALRLERERDDLERERNNLLQQAAAREQRWGRYFRYPFRLAERLFTGNIARFRKLLG